MVRVAVGCPVSKKERVRDTAVARGKARVEMPLKDTRTVRLCRPLYRNVGNMAAMMPDAPDPWTKDTPESC